MDLIDLELKNVTRELSRLFQGQVSSTALEISELRRQLQKAESRYCSQLNAQARLGSYVPSTGSAYRCPNCWISEGVAVALQSLESVGTAEHFLRCPQCNRDFGIPTGLGNPSFNHR